MTNWKIEKRSLQELKGYDKNPRKFTKKGLKDLKASLKKCGDANIITINADNTVLGGHARLTVMKELGYETVDVKVPDRLLNEKEVQEIVIRLNANTAGEWDLEKLAVDFEVSDLEEWGLDIDLSADNSEEEDEIVHQKLSDKFLIPPFDIFDAKQKRWIDRKKQWNKLIKDKAQARENSKVYTNIEYSNVSSPEVSILDAVLAEIINLWFTPFKGCNTFDCFAGDTVFGYVSSYLGNIFTGIELRQEQADFNNKQTEGLNAKYICDDGQNVAEHIEAESQDLLFSCPPYFDLEVYSDLENDASNQESYEDFLQILDNAFTNAVKCLKNNRFAVITVGDVRNKKTGEYYNFPNDIINIFTRNGLKLYNNIKLLTPIGTAQIRAGKYMKNRKTAHIYQDVLVFYKGDTNKIKENFGEVEVMEIESTDV